MNWVNKKGSGGKRFQEGGHMSVLEKLVGPDVQPTSQNPYSVFKTKIHDPDQKFGTLRPDP